MTSIPNRTLAYLLAVWDGKHGPDFAVRKQVQRLLRKPSSDVENYTGEQMLIAKAYPNAETIPKKDLAAAIAVLNEHYGADDFLNEKVLEGVVESAHALMRDSRDRLQAKVAERLTENVVKVLMSPEFIQAGEKQ